MDATDVRKRLAGVQPLFIDGKGVPASEGKTLEIINPAQKRMIDDVEVGRPVAPKFRVAFEVADAVGTTRDLTAAGAELIAAPTETPWRSLNARLEAPDLQVTVFQELDATPG